MTDSTNSAKQLKQVSESKSSDILFCIAVGFGRSFVGSSDFGIYEIGPGDENERIAFADGHESYVTGMTSANGQLVTGSYDRKLIWWDIETRKPMRTITAHDRWIRRVMATPGGRHIVTVADDMLCKVWDAETAELVAAFTDHRPTTAHNFPSMLYALAISDDGQFIATGDRVGHAVVWQTSNWEKVGEVECPVMYTWDPVKRRHATGGIRSLSFSPDSERLAVGGIGTIGNIDHLGGPSRFEVFEWKTSKQLYVAEDNKRKGLVEQMMWSDDGSWILSAGGDHQGFVTISDATSGEQIHQATTGGHIHGFALDQDTQTLVTVGHERLTRWSMTAAIS